MIMKFDEYETNEGYMNVPGQPSYVLDAAKLHYHKDSRTFSAEVSDLGRSFNPMYRGGLEIIVVRNTQTGNDCEYLKYKEKRDDEHELQYTIYKPEKGSVGDGTELIIWND